MRIQLLSDLHHEFRRAVDDKRWVRSMKAPDVDVLVLAGDVCNWVDQVRTRDLLALYSQTWTDVILVPGNHELYGTSTNDLRSLVGKYPSNVEIVFEPRAIQVRGQRFLCGTGWYQRQAVEDAGIDANSGTWLGPRGMLKFSDFREILGLTPWAYEQNQKLRTLLETQLHCDNVVVTHHLPSWECVSPRFVGETENVFFVNDQLDLIEQRNPKLWLLGHTHDSISMTISKTKLRSNPCGYPKERRGESSWDPKCVVLEL